MEKTITKDVVYARIRVAGLKRAADTEQNPKALNEFLNILRDEEDRLNNYQRTGIYEKY